MRRRYITLPLKDWGGSHTYNRYNLVHPAELEEPSQHDQERLHELALLLLSDEERLDWAKNFSWPAGTNKNDPSLVGQ